MRRWPALELQIIKTKSLEILPGILMDFQVTAIEEKGHPSLLSSWRICFYDELSRDKAMQAISNYPSIKILKISSLTINDNDWAIKSQDGLRAIRIGNVILAPPWDVPLNPRSVKSCNLYPGTKDPLVIIIEPSMGFGTGHHPTTRLSLWGLQQLDLHGQTLIDIGTGSGVLALSAACLGADRVVAIDNDLDAILAAKKNLALARISKVTFLNTDLENAVFLQKNFLVSNLSADLLIRKSKKIEALGKEKLILSGFTVSEEAAILLAFPSWKLQYRKKEDGWVGIVLTRNF
tara:strand:+ start:551 stop:1423 length:873 start_codon:yes stop_codon:yes gene_type:complete